MTEAVQRRWRDATHLEMILGGAASLAVPLLESARQLLPLRGGGSLLLALLTAAAAPMLVTYRALGALWVELCGLPSPWIGKVIPVLVPVLCLLAVALPSRRGDRASSTDGGRLDGVPLDGMVRPKGSREESWHDAERLSWDPEASEPRLR